MASYKLDKGFLFDYGWEGAMRLLTPKQFHEVFWALYDYQKSEGKEPIPTGKFDPKSDIIITFVKLQIDNRIEGSENGKKSAALRRFQNEMNSIN